MGRLGDLSRWKNTCKEITQKAQKDNSIKNMKVKIFKEYNEKIQQTSKKEILEIREKREAIFEEIMPKNFPHPKRDLKPQILEITCFHYL